LAKARFNIESEPWSFSNHFLVAHLTLIGDFPHFGHQRAYLPIFHNFASILKQREENEQNKHEKREQDPYSSIP
jgi:hypothetical protein